MPFKIATEPIYSLEVNQEYTKPLWRNFEALLKDKTDDLNKWRDITCSERE